MEKIASTYLKELNIPVSKNYCEKLVASHPDYPSILSISDTFERLGIRHNVARIEKKDLPRFPFPYLLHLDRGAGEFIFIRDQNDLKTKQEKLEAWDGVVMLAEPTRTIHDVENDSYLSEERFNKISTVLFALSASLLLILFALRSFTEGGNVSWITLFLLATAIGGVVLGYLLIAKDLGIRYEAVESFCNAGKNTNCDRVLTSQNAVIFRRSKFSDAVLSYFTFQLVVLGFLVPVMGESNGFLWILSAGSMFAIPVVVYSVYLQGKVLKSWCRLCLLVDAVLLIQVALFGWMYMANMLGWSHADLWAIVLSSLSLLATASLIFLLKNRVDAGRQAEKAERSANRVKYDPDVFTHLLFEEREIDHASFEREITIGNNEVPIRILMAASLGCGPCREGFEKTVQLVEQYPDKVNLSMRFLMPENSNGQHPDPGKYLLSYWLGNIYGKKNVSDRSAKLIRDWYALKDSDSFKEIYPQKTHEKNEVLSSLVVRHSSWFEETGIVKTPTFFINGYELPKNYNIVDLKGTIPGLVERFQQKNTVYDREEITS